MQRLNPQFANKIIAWYKKNARPLPWRKTSDPYKIWISEIMLQQTTVNAVIPYYLKWVKLFPDVYAVSKAPEQKVLKAWEGLGYYQRARNIHSSAKRIVRDFNGSIPSDKVTLKTLPGFGPYTVGAVLSIAFNKREPIIDANVRRVFIRILLLEGKADNTHDKTIYKILEKIMPDHEMNIFNQALMEVGALICRSKQPQCLMCPLKALCLAYASGKQEIIPIPKKITIQKIDAVIAVIKRSNKFLIQKRLDKGLLAGLWEFPGGKVVSGEENKNALKRELLEELDCEIKDMKHLFNVFHFYTHFQVKLHVYACSLLKRPQATQTLKWVTLRQISKYPMPSGSAKIVDYLKEQ